MTRCGIAQAEEGTCAVGGGRRAVGVQPQVVVHDRVIHGLVEARQLPPRGRFGRPRPPRRLGLEGAAPSRRSDGGPGWRGAAGRGRKGAGGRGRRGLGEAAVGAGAVAVIALAVAQGGGGLLLGPRVVPYAKVREAGAEGPGRNRARELTRGAV